MTDPFGAWKEGEPGPVSLLSGLGRNQPGLLVSPGDVDGDGRDDAVLATREGFRAPRGLVPIAPTADLVIKRNEMFAVEYKIPVPVLGNWSGQGRELVFFHDDSIVSYRGVRETDRVPLPLPTHGKNVDSIRRNHVFVRDIDGDGRLDLLVVVARGSTGSFSFEATARFFHGGRIYHHGKQGFFRPRSFLKVAGVLLKSTLIDLDSDGDLDLILSSVIPSAEAAIRGNADGLYHCFRFEKRAFRRLPAWTFKGSVPLSTFTEKPVPPVRFLPDLDGDGRPEALAVGPTVILYEANREGDFRRVARIKLKGATRSHAGTRRAALAHESGIVVVEGR